MDNISDFVMAATEIAGTVAVGAIVLKEALSVYVRTPRFTSKVISDFGGKPLRATVPGGSFKKPWPMERVAFEVDQTLQIVDFLVNIKDKDNNFFDVPIQIHYEISDPIKSARLPDLAKRKQVMQTLAQNVIRSHFADQDLQAVYQSNNQMATLVKAELQTNMADYGMTIRDTVVENPVLSPELKTAMQAVVIADRGLEASRKTSEATKVKLVAQAEGEQALLLAQAAGERARLIAKAEGEGAIRVAQAEAEEKARLALGRGVAGEQTEIAKGFKESIENMTAAGITAAEAMDYLRLTNKLQYGRQNVDALADAYKGMTHAVLFADAPNPAHMMDGDVTTGDSAVGELKGMTKILAAVEALRPMLANRQVTATPTPTK